jgi:hypothetical protein
VLVSALKESNYPYEKNWYPSASIAVLSKINLENPK